MADIAITAANVKGAGGSVANGAAGATITAGEVVYKDTATSKYKVSDANSAGAESADGIALNGGSDGQPMAVQTRGRITVGGTLTAGTPYFLSATAGAICPFADLSTGDAVVLLGIALSTTLLDLHIVNTGVTL